MSGQPCGSRNIVRNSLRAGAFFAAIWSGLAGAACDSATHRQFDFWLGDWVVHTAQGRLAGTNTISSAHGGCVITENYTTPTGRYSGQSLNAYDAARDVWHQTWMDSAGLVLMLEGRFAEGSMTLEGHTRGSDGQRTGQRIRWTPHADGRVRQLWEQKAPDAEWTVVFDGWYSRAPATDVEK
ncbi:MAG: hypothetical protein ABF296_01685 [Oceanococcaceae bacterium]